jgi:hypothetical protein
VRPGTKAITAAVLLLCCPAASAQSRQDTLPTSGPIFVPLDSWIYPVLSRLSALGYIPDQAPGVRPWTRRECRRQWGEAEALWTAGRGNSHDEARRLIEVLRREFRHREEPAPRGAYLALDSVYLRALGIAGDPLADGYNLGQTIVNDLGRPFGEGANLSTGFEIEAGAGRFSFYTRSEFQRSAPFTSPARALAVTLNQIVPVRNAAPGGIERFQPLEMYVGAEFGKWALTMGSQSLWWGPGEAGPLSFGDNSAPFPMFRLTSAIPLGLPGFLRRFGVFRLDLVGGELTGHHLPARPLVNAQKLAWNITDDLEVAFTRWSLFDGAGVHAFTAGSVIRNLFANGATFGNAADPGDRKSGFDISWRPPLPGRSMTLFAELYADDEPSPLASPRRSAFSPGIYLARLPALPHWDLRVEAPSTRGVDKDRGGLFFYWNNVYHDANTNDGELLGNWVGRDGRGLFVQANYWRLPSSRFEFTFRQNRIGSAYLPGGGTQDDAGIRTDFYVGADWRVSASAQYERYLIPAIGPLKRNVTASFDLLYHAGWRLGRN